MTDRLTVEVALRVAAERAYGLARSEIFDAPGYEPGAVPTRGQAAILTALRDADQALTDFRDGARDHAPVPMALHDMPPVGWSGQGAPATGEHSRADDPSDPDSTARDEPR